MLRKLRVFNAKLEAYLSSNAFSFLFLGLYATAVSLFFIWGAYEQFYFVQKKYPSFHNLKWYLAIARGTGYALNLNCALVILLSCRLILTWYVRK